MSVNLTGARPPFAQQYESLLHELDSLAVQANCGSLKAYGKFERSGNRVAFQCTAYLPSWKYRSAPTNKSLHILIQVREALELGATPPILKKSVVHVCYFEEENELARLLLGVHYDYDGPQASHPIFHAQLTNNEFAFDPEAAGEVQFPFTQECNRAFFGKARIPTSDMTMPSVALCLAADHLPSELFPGFLGKVEELQQKMPHPDCSRTRDSLKTDCTDMRSSHWFAHDGIL